MKENVDSKWFGSHTGYVHHHGKQRWAAVFVAPQLNKEPTHLGFYRNRRNAIRAVRLEADRCGSRRYLHSDGPRTITVSPTYNGPDYEQLEDRVFGLAKGSVLENFAAMFAVTRMYDESDDELRRRVRQGMVTANYGGGK